MEAPRIIENPALVAVKGVRDDISLPEMAEQP